VLFISEDLDEVFDIADRIAVMSSGRIVYQTARVGASRNAIGRAMAGAAVLARLSQLGSGFWNFEAKSRVNTRGESLKTRVVKT
jgi:ABC-type sugar transport system ATPase subunit